MKLPSRYYFKLNMNTVNNYMKVNNLAEQEFKIKCCLCDYDYISLIEHYTTIDIDTIIRLLKTLDMKFSELFEYFFIG